MASGSPRLEGVPTDQASGEEESKAAGRGRASSEGVLIRRKPTGSGGRDSSSRPLGEGEPGQGEGSTLGRESQKGKGSPRGGGGEEPKKTGPV